MRRWSIGVVTMIALVCGVLVTVPGAQADEISPAPLQGDVQLGVPTVERTCTNGVPTSLAFSISYDATELDQALHLQVISAALSEDLNDGVPFETISTTVAAGSTGTITQDVLLTPAAQALYEGVFFLVSDEGFDYSAVSIRLSCTAPTALHDTPPTLTPSFACGSPWTIAVDATDSTLTWQPTMVLVAPRRGAAIGDLVAPGTTDTWDITPTDPTDADAFAIVWDTEDTAAGQFLRVYGGVFEVPSCPAPCDDERFTDVSASHPFCKEITWMAAEELTTGYPDGTFRPAGPVSREAMAAFLWRWAGEPEASTTAHFADVPASHPFFPAIQWLYETSLSTGTAQPGGKPLYKPSDKISRQAMGAFLWRIVGQPQSSTTDHFADVHPGDPFYAAIQWMSESGLSTGTVQPSGKPLYKPVDPVSRQAMSAFLYRLHKVLLLLPPASPQALSVPGEAGLADRVAAHVGA